MATTSERVTALEKAVKALTARVAALETPAPPTPPPPVPDPPTVPTTPPPGSVGVPAGTVLRPVGAMVVTSPGQVVDALDVAGGIDVRAKGVVIRRCRVVGSGPCAIWVRDGGSVVVEDSEVTGAENGIGFDNWTARRVLFTGQYGDGVKLGSNVKLEDSVIRDLRPAAGAHADGGQLQFGAVNLVIRRNTIDLGTTPDANAALFLCPDQGPSTDGPILVEGNYLNGGNYTLALLDGANGAYHVRNVTIRGNRFGPDHAYGTHNVNEPCAWTGNTDMAGRPLSL